MSPVIITQYNQHNKIVILSFVNDGIVVLRGRTHIRIKGQNLNFYLENVWSKYYGGLREYYGELREFPDKSSNFDLLYGRVCPAP